MSFPALIRCVDGSVDSISNPDCFVTSTKATQTSSIGDVITANSGRTSGAAQPASIAIAAAARGQVENLRIIVRLASFPLRSLEVKGVITINCPRRRVKGKARTPACRTVRSIFMRCGALLR